MPAAVTTLLVLMLHLNTVISHQQCRMCAWGPKYYYAVADLAHFQAIAVTRVLPPCRCSLAACSLTTWSRM